MEDFIKEFKRIESNPIYFLDKYYNALNSEKLELTDEQKQELYDKFKGVPFFDDFNVAIEYSKKIEELKEKGYKDWEIL